MVGEAEAGLVWRYASPHEVAGSGCLCAVHGWKRNERRMFLVVDMHQSAFGCSGSSKYAVAAAGIMLVTRA